jgi:hypothetical protein
MRYTGYWVKFTSEARFWGLLLVIRSPSYLVWFRTFLLGVGLTDLSHFGRHWGQNKAVASAFNRSVVYCNVGVALIFLAKVVVRFKQFAST